MSLILQFNFFRGHVISISSRNRPTEQKYLYHRLLPEYFFFLGGLIGFLLIILMSASSWRRAGRS